MCRDTVIYALHVARNLKVEFFLDIVQNLKNHQKDTFSVLEILYLCDIIDFGRYPPDPKKCRADLSKTDSCSGFESIDNRDNGHLLYILICF